MEVEDPVTDNDNDVRDISELVIGAVAGTAYNAGWSEGEAALIGLRAREAASGRVALGQALDEALPDAVQEAEMVLIMNHFANTLSETGSTDAAYESAFVVKRAILEDDPGAEAALSATRAIFDDALQAGLAPHAALLSAFITFASTLRRASRN